MDMLVVVKGAGDLATGVAHRLYRCGMRVVMTEIPQPTVVRRSVSFAEAVYETAHVVEGVTARLARNIDQAAEVLQRGEIPVLVDPQTREALRLRPSVLVDAVMAKKNTGTQITDAPLVIGLGPGFTAGLDVHAVIETNRGHHLGRVIENGCAQPNTGIPGPVQGYTLERLVRAPADGVFQACVEINRFVQAGELLGYVGDQPVRAGIAGLLRGLIREGTQVCRGLKIGDIDPRGEPEHGYTISDKARAVAGGVLEAVFYYQKQCCSTVDAYSKANES